jgi:aspartate 1-decarboxylase
VIIAAYAQVDRSELADFRARVALVDPVNRITEVREVALADCYYDDEEE